MSKVKFSDVVVRANTKEDRHNTDLQFYVGGEHIDSDEVVIEKRGLIAGSTIGPMFYFGFKAGQVLFVSRNPHLRKAGMVTFDGICSEKTFVLETKDETVLLQRYLPFVLQSDHFWAYAEAHKSGSVNFFINWTTLAEYEFELPSIQRQQELADILWAMTEARLAYNKLLQATDDMIQSRFIEMFGSVEENVYNYPIKKIGDFADCYPGATPSTKVKEFWEGGTIPWMSSGEVHKGHVFDTDQKITQAGYDHASTRMVPKHSIVIALAGQGKTRGTVAINEIELCTNQSLCAIIPDETVVLTDYLYHNLNGRYEELRDMSTVPGGRGGLSLGIVSRIPVLIPPIQKQKEYAEFVKKCEASKAEIALSIERILLSYKSVLSENFT